MKTYKITEKDIEELIYLLNHHSIMAAKKMLNQLEELKPKENKQ